MTYGNVIRRVRAYLAAKASWLRTVLRRVAGHKRGDPLDDLHARVTFRACVDAVIPTTPELESELGPEYVPGGNDVGVAEFLAVYVDDRVQIGLPHTRRDVEVVKPVANVLDSAALKLIARGRNEDEPNDERAVALFEGTDVPAERIADVAGPFARLSPRDRLRAIHVLDEIEAQITLRDGRFVEFDGGLVGQLVVGFPKLIYYSEWEGYPDHDRMPFGQDHPNDPAAVQGWRQTGFPGFTNGYACLRGYLGTADGSLGSGDAWTTIDDRGGSPVSLLESPGEFRENEYDTADYVEPYPEGGG